MIFAIDQHGWLALTMWVAAFAAIFIVSRSFLVTYRITKSRRQRRTVIKRVHRKG